VPRELKSSNTARNNNDERSATDIKAGGGIYAESSNKMTGSMVARRRFVRLWHWGVQSNRKGHCKKGFVGGTCERSCVVVKREKGGIAKGGWLLA